MTYQETDLLPGEKMHVRHDPSRPLECLTYQRFQNHCHLQPLSFTPVALPAITPHVMSLPVLLFCYSRAVSNSSIYRWRYCNVSL